MKNNNLYVKAIIGLVSLAIVFLMTSTAFAQGNFSRNKAKRVDASKISQRILKDSFKMDIEGCEDCESKYFFEVGAGETILKIKVKAKQDNAGAYLYFTDKNGDEIVPFVLVQGNTIEGDGFETVKITTGKSMFVNLRIREQHYGSRMSYRGALRIDFSGAFISWEEEL